MFADLHCHSCYSDGSASIDNIIYYAKRIGLDYIPLYKKNERNLVCKLDLNTIEEIVYKAQNKGAFIFIGADWCSSSKWMLKNRLAPILGKLDSLGIELIIIELTNSVERAQKILKECGLNSNFYIYNSHFQGHPVLDRMIINEIANKLHLKYDSGVPYEVLIKGNKISYEDIYDL